MTYRAWQQQAGDPVHVDDLEADLVAAARHAAADLKGQIGAALDDMDPAEPVAIFVEWSFAPHATITPGATGLVVTAQTAEVGIAGQSLR